MGFLRLFLALSVIAGHAQTTVFGVQGIGAWYAVNFFFIISGFYMAMVINEKYKSINPVVFYKSRLLRLFPTYYVGLAIALIVSFASIVSNFSLLTVGAKIYFIFQNLFIFGQDLSYVFCSGVTTGGCANPASMTINPPAWSLAVELGFYLIAPFVLKSIKKTYIFVAFGCAYLLLLNFLNFPLQSGDFINAIQVYAFNYYFYPSSFIFFGGGALAYHLSKRSVEPSYIAAVAMLGVLSFTVTTMPFWHLFFFAMAMPVLFQYTKSNRIDRIIGELSYPAYILHFPILIFFRMLASVNPEYFSVFGVGTWVAVLSCVLGLLVYYFIDKRVDAYRHSSEFLTLSSSDDGKKSSARIMMVVCIYLLAPVGVLISLYSDNYKSPFASYNPAFNLTDSNWLSGMSRARAAFLVESSKENIEIYSVGSNLRFSNGDTRKIIEVSASGPLLNVYFDGHPLSGAAVGYPHAIEIKK